MRTLLVLGVVGLWGCHLMLPFGSGDGPAGDSRPDGTRPDLAPHKDVPVVATDGSRLSDQAHPSDAIPKVDRFSIDATPKPDQRITKPVSWTKLMAPALPPLLDDFLDVSGSTASDVFVVSGTTVLHYNGLLWTAVPVDSLPLGHRQFTAVAVPQPKQALVGGQGGLFTWTITAQPGCASVCATLAVEVEGVWVDGSTFYSVGTDDGGVGLWTGCILTARPGLTHPRAIWRDSGTPPTFFIVGDQGLWSWSSSLGHPITASLNDVHGGLAVGDGGLAYRWDVSSKKWTQEYTNPSGSSLKGAWSDGTLSLAVGVVGNTGVVLRKQAPLDWVQDSLPQTTPLVPQLNAVWVSPSDANGSRKAFAVGQGQTILSADL